MRDGMCRVKDFSQGGPFGVPPQQPAYGVAPAPQQAYGAYAPQQSPSYGPPPNNFAYAAPPPIAMVNPNQKNPGLAVALELIGGFTLQTFGIGHLYAGNIGMGLGLMFGYWALTAINIALCFVLVGFVTWPLTWIAFMVLSAITANNAVKKANARPF